MPKVFVSDCEGPISKNDNAFEVTSNFVPNGDRLFAAISRYDDLLADVVRRSDYKAGDTLKLIVPFLKAYDVTDEKLMDFSANSLSLVPLVKEALQHVRSLAFAFVVSTSYEHYVRVLCRSLSFPFENTYCTMLCLDEYELMDSEKARLREIAEEIARISIIKTPVTVRSLKDLSEEDQIMVRRMDEIFWREIASMKAGKIYSQVNPVGGSEKAKAIEDIAEKRGVTLQDIMYVGDSITDVEAFKLVKENGGLSVSFNGNQYAVRNAEIAILSENSIVIAIVAFMFIKLGKAQTMKIIENWSIETLKKSSISRALLDRFFETCSATLPKVKIITGENMDTLTRESSEFRSRVRGEAIGSLG